MICIKCGPGYCLGLEKSPDFIINFTKIPLTGHRLEQYPILKRNICTLLAQDEARFPAGDSVFSIGKRRIGVYGLAIPDAAGHTHALRVRLKADPDGRTWTHE